MSAAWVHRNEHGVVRGAIVAEYADASHLREWRQRGLRPELVDFGDANITVNRPLPEGARVVMALDPSPSDLSLHGGKSDDR